MEREPDLQHPVLVHFYRALVGHMDVWRQRMDATTNWAAATTAAMVTFCFGTVESPHFVLLLAMGFNGVFLLMESRRYQIFDLWRRRFRLMNRYFVSPVLANTGAPVAAEQGEGLERIATDLGRLVPHLPLNQAIGYRIRRNYAYLFIVSLIAWVLKLEVHPTPAERSADLVARAAVGSIPGAAVIIGLLVIAIGLAILAIRAPSEQMLDWTDVPSPYHRWVTRSQEWGRGLLDRSVPPEEGKS